MQDLKDVSQSIRWFLWFTPVVNKCSVGFTQLCLRLVSLSVSLLRSFVRAPLHTISGSEVPVQDHSHHSTPCTRTSKGEEGSGHFASSSRCPFLTHSHVTYCDWFSALSVLPPKFGIKESKTDLPLAHWTRCAGIFHYWLGRRLEGRTVGCCFRLRKPIVSFFDLIHFANIKGPILTFSR